MNQPKKALSKHLTAQQIAEILELISDHVYISKINPDGSRSNVYISPQVEELTGYKVMQVLKDWSLWPKKIIAKQDQQTISEYGNITKPGQSYITEYRIRRRNGRLIWVRDSARLVRDKTSQQVYVYGLIGNIDKIKKTEQALSQQSKQLEKTVKLRTQKLQQLVLSQKRFIGDVSHELRNPLALIAAIVQTALQPHAPQLTRKELHLITEKINHLASTLKNLMYISKIEFDQIGQQHQKINLKKLTDQILEQFSLTSRKTLSFNNRIKNDLSIYTDKTILELVITNLINNAITHGNKPHSRIRLTAEIKNDKIICHITDNNPPIPKSIQANIFNRYTSQKSTQENAGIGLYISRQLMHRLNGELILTTSSTGNTFTIVIPS